MNANISSYVEDEILQYLKKHPHAADTVDGITSWWLNQNKKKVDISVVKSVLIKMEKNNMVRVYRSAEGKSFYCRIIKKRSADSSKGDNK